MNTGFPEMLYCLNSKSESSEMSVVERRRSPLKCRQEQSGQRPPPATHFNGNGQLSFLGLNSDQGLCELVVNGAMKPDPGIENDDFQRLSNYGSGRWPNVAAGIANQAAGKQSCRKRMKGCAAEESKVMEQNSTTTTVSTSTNKRPSADPKQSSSAAAAAKTDYIHVRARRGQATDSHSLAERVRRERISERMKYLQDLVPGCSKVIGKAGMLDEIINYVQSMQRQVEFLSMKLAAIRPRLDFDIDNYLYKVLFPASTMAASSGNDRQLPVIPSVSVPQTFLDASSLNQIQQTPWEDELQNLYRMECQQGRSSTSFTSQPITGFVEAGHVKLEM